MTNYIRMGFSSNLKALWLPVSVYTTVFEIWWIYSCLIGNYTTSLFFSDLKLWSNFVIFCVQIFVGHTVLLIYSHWKCSVLWVNFYLFFHKRVYSLYLMHNFFPFFKFECPVFLYIWMPHFPCIIFFNYFSIFFLPPAK